MLDDGLDFEESFDKAKFCFNEEKRICVPIQKHVWLDITWNCQHGTIRSNKAELTKQLPLYVIFYANNRFLQSFAGSYFVGSIMSNRPAYTFLYSFLCAFVLVIRPMG